MLIEPDFPDHWKVQHLVRRLESEGAVRCLLRLWANCQQRKGWVFPFKPLALASLCRWEGEPGRFWDAMTDPETGWLEEEIVEQEGNVPRVTMWRVRQWEVHNNGLIANWNRNPTGKNGRGAGESGGKAGSGRGGGPRTSPGPSPERPSDMSKTPPIEKIDREDREDRVDRDSPPGEAARLDRIPSIDAALAWAERFNAGEGVTRGLQISREMVLAWHDDRCLVGWVTVRGGAEIPIADWQADLRDFTKWKLGGGGGSPRKKEGADFSPSNGKRGVVLLDERLPSPPCDWRRVLDGLYPPEEYADLDRSKAWGLYQLEVRREVESECRRTGLLAKDWVQPLTA